MDGADQHVHLSSSGLGVCVLRRKIRTIGMALVLHRFFSVKQAHLKHSVMRLGQEALILSVCDSADCVAMVCWQ